MSTFPFTHKHRFSKCILSCRWLCWTYICKSISQKLIWWFCWDTIDYSQINLESFWSHLTNVSIFSPFALCVVCVVCVDSWLTALCCPPADHHLCPSHWVYLSFVAVKQMAIKWAGHKTRNNEPRSTTHLPIAEFHENREERDFHIVDWSSVNIQGFTFAASESLESESTTIIS